MWRHLPGNVFDLLPTDHDCYLFHDLFQQLDTSSIESRYSPLSQRAYHPGKLVGILIYGYSHGVFSSRQLEKRCNEDLSFMYIAGKNCPNFRVLSDFRKDHARFFHDCFTQTVKRAVKRGLSHREALSPRQISVDETSYRKCKRRQKPCGITFGVFSMR